MTKSPTGYVFYKGPSMFDGQPIVGIAVLESKNPKTGNMVQCYILRDNGKSPYDNAMDTLEDESICGSCSHRRGTGGDCYVELLRGPHSVWKSYIAGKYPQLSAGAVAFFLGERHVRLGAYGDPFAIPSYTWMSLLHFAAGWTGYTQAWKRDDFANNPHIMNYCMASCENAAEWVMAVDCGFRPYRIRRSVDEPLLKHEFACPASEEEGYRKTCTTCMACHGGVDTRKATPVIVVHGTRKGAREVLENV